jgi:hypothetical protein
MYIDDTPGLTVLQIRSIGRRLQAEHGMRLLIIDYVQLIQPLSNSENMVQQFTEIVYTRVRGRQMAFRIGSDGLGVQWQLGVPTIDVRPDGRR